MNRTTIAAALLATLASASAFAEIKEKEDGSGQPGKSIHLTRDASRNRGSGNRISYHGGPLIPNGINVYLIWYGNWSANSATTLMPALIQNLSGSPYFKINTTYSTASQVVQNAVYLAGTTTVGSPYKTSLSDADVQSIVTSAISGGKLANDPHGLYFVLTSKDVNETSGFCTQYCGWHWFYAQSGGSTIKYSFVGNPDRCPSACEWQTNSPSGNSGFDGMASIVAHELEETVTDPEGTAWYDNRGYENADKCAWTFGSTSKTSTGALYNMTMNGTNYLIQQNWVNASGGYCAKSY